MSYQHRGAEVDSQSGCLLYSIQTIFLHYKTNNNSHRKTWETCHICRVPSDGNKVPHAVLQQAVSRNPRSSTPFPRGSDTHLSPPVRLPLAQFSPPRKTKEEGLWEDTTQYFRHENEQQRKVVKNQSGVWKWGAMGEKRVCFMFGLCAYV